MRTKHYYRLDTNPPVFIPTHFLVPASILESEFVQQRLVEHLSTLT